MKKLFFYLAAALISVVFSACDDSQKYPNGYVPTTVEGSSTFVFQGMTSAAEGFNVLQPSEFYHPLYVQNGSFAGDYYMFAPTEKYNINSMGEAPSPYDDAWSKSVAIQSNKCYWVLCNGKASYKFIKMRVAYIQGNNVGVEYIFDDNVISKTEGNSNSNFEETNEAAWELEMPKLNADNYFAPHYVTYNGKEILNYSLEWNMTMRHSTWVAFSWNAATSADNVNRSDNWKWDPTIPEDCGAVYASDHSLNGYDKGHLVASEDRVYCKAANEQTFYFSNVSPQISRFNQQIWADVEDLVRGWGRSTVTGTYDVVYAAKGGTTNELLKNFKGTVKAADGTYPMTDAEGYNVKNLAVPAYYYMAILAEKDGKYQAIALCLPHSETLTRPSEATDLQQYVVSIDQLESKTGIDFFCNLPDVIENEVEKSVDLTKWAW